MKTFLWVILFACGITIVLNAHQIIDLGLIKLGIIGIIFMITECCLMIVTNINRRM